MKTSIASLTAGAVMIMVGLLALVETYLIPPQYESLYRTMETPAMLIIGLSLFEYGRRLAKKRGEGFPL